MTSTSPPLEAQRFGRSQTPESPRPVHLSEPSNIPVLQMQMDPVFNDTSTYDTRPSTQPVSSHLADDPFQENITHDQPLARHETVEDFLASAGQTVDYAVPAVSLFSNDLSNKHPSLASSLFASANVAPAASDALHVSYPATESHHSNPTPGGDDGPFADTAQMPTVAQEDPASSILLDKLVANDPPQPQPGQSENDPIPQTQTQSSETMGDGVDFQSLLQDVTQSVSTAPASDSITAATTAARPQDEAVQERALPSVPGLPPKPPPQDYSRNFPSYPNDSTKYYSLLSQAPNASPDPSQSLFRLHNADASSANHINSELYATTASNGLPPPPSNIDQQRGYVVPLSEDPPTSARPLDRAQSEASRAGSSNEGPWSTDVQAMYDQFLADERNYVTEGVWDKFPAGSRLFVGNLPTEKVTKRDLFHVFHRYGRLAQVSIKQAYGFVQFLEANACYNALAAEQGVEIRGRKIHLEISKPQRNTRNAGSGNAKSTARRRSRSPDRGVVRAVLDRTPHPDRLPFSDFRDEPGRRRDDYRPVRSPSPRGYRARDEYRSRDRSPRMYGGYSARSRSPAYNSSYQPLSPKVFDEDATLPLARREPRDVPDVQVLILEEVAPQFINYVEQGFRQKGLRASTTWLNQRLTLAAVVKRQILEGVQAVVKLTRNSQFNSKIPLQVFDRAAGASNVNFLEYIELDIPIAADIVIQARQKERANSQAPVPAPMPYVPNQTLASEQHYSYPQQLPSQLHSQQFYQQQTPHSYPPQPTQAQPHFAPQPAPLYQPPAQVPQAPNSNPPNLQELLANLRQPSSPQQPQHQHSQLAQSARPTDLGSLLSNVAARQHNQSHQYNQSHQPPQPQQYGNQLPINGFANQQSTNGYGFGAQPPQQNVQNVMDQLARYHQR